MVLQANPDPRVSRQHLLNVLAEVKAAAAEEQGDAATRQLEAAEALATRDCAHPRCATLGGTSEADMPKGRRCAKCQLARYCGVDCQTAAWPAHKAACRVLRKRLA